ncbi:hypothetical protein E4U24_008285 [Claviceps purpurea]|nr:hypothetical protein E4U51_002994 [Claviceps purpurea]KAG6194271.1 hypothetical protein E4U10_003135 [Claviceps purpurea]KAG6235367.1 hypothetical protein E4U24_008285 [Claviceps purpurea]KAG6262933.1 hypothetical protein E4U49_002740 [Claviceps purpurea]
MSHSLTSATIKVILSLAVFLTSLQLLSYFYTPSIGYVRPRLAKTTYAAELLTRTPSRTPGVVPKIFHQSWKSLELPTKFQEWSLSCRQKHKGWEWVVWTDEDNLRLVQQHFPWLEDVYNGLPGVIYRADLARHLYMYIYGGVYADLDTECLHPTEDLQHEYGPIFGKSKTPLPDRAIFGRMGTNPDFEHSIPNAWMAATPGHPFFLLAIQHVMSIYNETKSQNKIGTPESVTGPIALRDSIIKYEEDKIRQGPALGDSIKYLTSVGPFAQDQAENHEVLLLPSHLIYPYSWAYGGEDVRGDCWVLHDTYNAETCKEKLGTEQAGSICITYWSHTHAGAGHSKENMEYIN